MEISTPGRICLFGEHQDYLGLPVISMAISLRIKLIGEKASDRTINIEMPDIGKHKMFSLDDLSYNHSRDYFKSGIRVCQNEGLIFTKGFTCKVTSEIPIAAGTSSSSALNVSWIHFLSKMADEPVDWNQKKIGEIAYKAEVKEFKESGGMMDQYSTSIGGLIYLGSRPKINIKNIHSTLGSFVLGDSQKSKDTISVLNRCKKNQKLVLDKVKYSNSNFSLFKDFQNLNLSKLTSYEKALFEALLKNRDILKIAYKELVKNKPDRQMLGKLLLRHHYNLRDVLKISTAKIELMLDSAIKAGALGGKINGSGGGGCMFAYAPDNPTKVARAIEDVGGKAYIVGLDKGTIKTKEE